MLVFDQDERGPDDDLRESDFPSDRAELFVGTVTTALDDLAEVVHEVDPVAWRLTYGDGRLKLG